MKLVIQVRLLPDGEQDQLLAATLHACNAAANEISALARERNIRNKRDLRAVTYGMAKARVPGAQAAQLTIAKVADSYTTHRANLRAGNYGKKDTARYRAAEQKVLRFRDDSAQPYDQRNLSWRHGDQTVSLWVTDTGNGRPGRIIVPFTGHSEQIARLTALPIGQCDLLHRDDKWYLYATVTIEPQALSFPEGAITTEQEWLGVDLGINQLAVTSDGAFYSGKRVTAHRRRQRDLRARLQAKQTKSATRLLKRRRRKEQRWMADVNHCVSKKLVAKAQRTGRGISVEDLTGIRDRVRLRASTRATLHSWSFAQLGEFIAYKAARDGVPFVQIDPRHTSQRCYRCGHTDRRNRRGEKFTCRSCGVVAHADLNAARNIRRKAPPAWVGAAS